MVERRSALLPFAFMDGDEATRRVLRFDSVLERIVEDELIVSTSAPMTFDPTKPIEGTISHLKFDRMPDISPMMQAELLYGVKTVRPEMPILDWEPRSLYARDRDRWPFKDKGAVMVRWYTRLVLWILAALSFYAFAPIVVDITMRMWAVLGW